jgi:uracil-DNA glycosylase
MYDLDRLRRMLLDRLESLHRAGVVTLPKAREDEPWLRNLTTPGPASSVEQPIASSPPASRYDLRPTTPRPTTPRPTTPASVRPVITTADNDVPPPESTVQEPAMPRRPAVSRIDAPHPVSLAQRVAELEALRCSVAECTLCPALVANRTQTVFGVGNPQARVAFFGEAPGADEDRQGEPFVGKAGQLLTKIIEACGFTRDDVYILNVLRCRPPDNRTPIDDEVENCRRWFEAQLAIVRPEYIVCAGAVPTKALFPSTKSIGQMRGKFHDWQGAKVLCTYHPAYLLRNPDAKRFVWDDMKLLLADMGLEIPQAKR